MCSFVVIFAFPPPVQCGVGNYLDGDIYGLGPGNYFIYVATIRSTH